MPRTAPSRKQTRRRAPTDLEKANAVGVQYAQDQLSSDYFMDWVRDQLYAADRMDPSKVLPLETKSDALVIAKNTLQQLEWDTKRDLDKREMDRLLGEVGVKGSDETATAFFDGFDATLELSRDWLADELLEIKSHMGGRSRLNEARRTGGTRGGPARKYFVVDQVQNGQWVQVGHFSARPAAEVFCKRLDGKIRIQHTFPSGHDHQPIFKRAAEAPARRHIASARGRRRA